MKLIVNNEKQLAELAHKLWKQHGLNRRKGVVFALEGPLGAGKTTFTRALAENMGVVDQIVSPTFVLHREYPQLDHVDAWRIEDPNELTNLGTKQMLEQNHVLVIEWADKVEDKIKDMAQDAAVVWIKIEPTKNDQERVITYENLSN